MTLDHIYQYFRVLGAPIWFNWLGRVVAPIFVFTAVEGYFHTRDRSRYMKRLYVSSVLMSVGSLVVPMLIARPDGMTIPNNIFSTIFLITVYIKSIETILEGKIKREKSKVRKGLAIGAIPIAASVFVALGYGFDSLGLISKVVDIAVPNPLTTEGGPTFIMIGIIMYFLRQDRLKMVAIYSFISLSILFSGSLDVQTVLFENYQWMMVFSSIFFLLYNGEKGRGMKYLFYVYYPGHIYFFYILSAILMVK
jgi:hypothetical protein